MPAPLRHWPMIVTFFAFFVLVAGTGPERALTQHEAWVAQPAREMLAGETWLAQPYAGELRFRKPPATSWLVAATFFITQTQNEFTARLPSVLAGVGVCLLVARIAGRVSPLHALLAGLACATSFYALLQARLAEADMPMAFFCTLAMTSILSESKTSIRIFYTALGMAFLFKGPIGPAIIFPGALLLLIHTRSARRLLDPVGIGIFLLISLAWPVALVAKHPEALSVWRVETIDRATGELGSNSESFFQYFWELPLMLMPWTPFIALGVWRHVRDENLEGRLTRVALCWLLPGFILLMVFPAKHKHYLLPLLPGLCIPAAIELRRAFETIVSLRNAIILGVIAFIGFGIAAVVVSQADTRGNVAIAITLGVVALLVPIATLIGRRSPLTAVACTFGVIGVAAMLQGWLINPAFDGYRIYRNLARHSYELVPPGETVVLLGLGEHQSAFYARMPLDRIDDPRTLDAKTPIYAITTDEQLQAIQQPVSIETLAAAEALRRRETEAERLRLVRISPAE